MEESPILDYVGPRRLSRNQYEKFQPYGIIGFDGKDISQAQHGRRAKELMEIQSNQIDPFGNSDTCSLNKEGQISFKNYYQEEGFNLKAIGSTMKYEKQVVETIQNWGS